MLTLASSSKIILSSIF